MFQTTAGYCCIIQKRFIIQKGTFVQKTSKDVSWNLPLTLTYTLYIIHSHKDVQRMSHLSIVKNLYKILLIFNSSNIDF